MGFVVNEVAQGQVLLRAALFFLQSLSFHHCFLIIVLQLSGGETCYRTFRDFCRSVA